MATSVGRLTEFRPDKEKVLDYLDRVSLYFEVNGVIAVKQVPVLLTAIRGDTYC